MADPMPPSEQRDPLKGDWSEGLPGPSRPLGIPAPQPLFVEAETAQVARPLEELAAQPLAEVETPDAWGAASEDPLHSAPPPAGEADAFAALASPAPVPALAEDEEIVELGEDDEAEPSTPPPSIAAAAASADVVWPAEAPAQSHEAALQSEIETAEPIVDAVAAVAAQEPVAAVSSNEPAWDAEPPPADWSTLSKGPDWSAPAPAAEAATEPAWGAPAEPAQTWSTESAWAAPAEGAPAAAAEQDWSAPPQVQPEREWTSANNTLLQMEGEAEPIAQEPGAAQELFGSVPVGGSLAEDDENELPAAEEVEDPDLPVPVEEEPADDADVPVLLEASEPPPAENAFTPIEASEPPPAEDAFPPIEAAEPPPAEDTEGAPPGLLVPGEHRVAVHTRGGSTKRGVVRDVDLSQPAFALEPAGGGEGESVQHDDVKAIFFMLAPGASAQPGGHGRVKVTFADGRTIEGERDGTEDKNGFFLVPQDAARTNTWRIYIARDATAEIRDL